MKARTTGPALALILLAFVWGYNWVAIKLATLDASALTLAALRAPLGTITLFAALALARRPLAPTPFWPTLRIGVLQTTLFSLLQFWAVDAGGAGRTAVLAYTMPLWVLLIAWPLLGERPRALEWTALGLSLAGLGFVLAPIQFGAGLVPKLAAVGGAIVWALSVVELKRLRARFNVDLLALTSWQMLWGSIPIVVLWWVLPHAPIHATVRLAILVAYIAIPATALAWFLWMYAVSRLSAGIAGLASLGTPVIGVVAAWLQLHEVPTRTELVGIAFILLALAVVGAIGLRPNMRPSPRS